jgi:FHA domain
MTTLEPVSVALKFGFLAVMYLFVLWVARSAGRDLRRGEARAPSAVGAAPEPVPPDATGMYSASSVGVAPLAHRSPRLSVERAPGHEPGMIYDLDEELVLGRGGQAQIRLEDPFASSRHTRVFPQGEIVVIEDLDSTNGTYLNEELLHGPQPLHPGDRVRIGDSEFTFEVE